MSVPPGSDPSTEQGESTGDRTDGDDETLLDTAADWARHWKALAVAAASFAVVGWAVIQPEASPTGYIPIFVGFAALAVGYVYLEEETQLRFASA
jgi:hypothetical protein